MEIETVEDLTNWLADKLGVYGTCKNAAKSEDCNEETPFCCRVGFMIEMTRRIEQAVENDKRLASAFGASAQTGS